MFNFGSLNIDNVYRVQRFVSPGETLAADGYARTVGGKGLNQSIALSRAGAEVVHAGAVGVDGAFLVAYLAQNGVSTQHILTSEHPTGHTVIMVDATGQNCILITHGANHALSSDYLDQVLDDARPGDLLLVQNETNLVAELLKRGKERGLTTVLNPSPVTKALAEELPYCDVDLLILNEVEAEALTGRAEPEAAMAALREKGSDMEILLTLGRQGAVYYARQGAVYQEAYPVVAVDTTAAGDTFTGYFLAGRLAGKEVGEALEYAARAAAVTVSRPGAAESIPTAEEMMRS